MSSDAQTFEVDVEVAKQSETVKQMLEGERRPLGLWRGVGRPRRPISGRRLIAAAAFEATQWPASQRMLVQTSTKLPGSWIMKHMHQIWQEHAAKQ